jgi:hypothetical protein
METLIYSTPRASCSAQEMDHPCLRTTPLRAALSCSGMAILVLVFLPTIVLFSSCYTARVYAPQGQNIPGFEQQHDVRASMSLAWSSDNNKHRYPNSLTGINAQAAYAPLNHWGFLMNYSHLKRRDSEVSRSFESGIGYFLPIKPQVIFENYVGIGMGCMSVDQYRNAVHLDGEIRRRHLFLQPSFTIKSSHVEVAFAMKTSRIDFFDLQLSTDELLLNDDKEIQKQIDTVREIEQKGGFTTLEPSFTLRGKLKNVKLELQLGISAAFDPILAAHTYPKFGSLGVQIAIPGRKKSGQCPSFNQCK